MDEPRATIQSNCLCDERVGFAVPVARSRMATRRKVQPRRRTFKRSGYEGGLRRGAGRRRRNCIPLLGLTNEIRNRSPLRPATTHTDYHDHHFRLRYFSIEGFNTMHSVQHCRDQAAECLRLMRLAQSEGEVAVLKYLSQSWSRLAGQTDRYNALRREQGRQGA